MANDVYSIRWYSTGVNLYAVIRDRDGKVADQNAGAEPFVAQVVANWGNYDFALSELPASGYQYSFTFPSWISAGIYYLDIYLRAGGSPAIGDTALFVREVVEWSGSAIVHYAGNTVQTGDAFAYLGTNMGALGANLTAADDAVMTRIGAAGAGLTALGDTRIANLDATVSSRMATYTQPTGFLAATFPTTVASTTNITGGTITTVTNLTNLPTIPADWITAAGIATDAFGALELAAGAGTEIAAAVRTELATELGRIDVTLSTRASQSSVDVIDGIVDSILVDTGTTLQAELDGIQADTEDIQTRLPAALTGAGNIKADALAINGSTTASTVLGATYAAFEYGTAQAGGASTVTLRAGASAVNDALKDQAIFLLSGTGAPQTNRITGYVGATKVATVGTAWVTQPDNTTVYMVLGRVE